jgi:hypothetical protein
MRKMVVLDQPGKKNFKTQSQWKKKAGSSGMAWYPRDDGTPKIER